MKKNNISKAARFVLLALPIMMLPGCGVLDWIKEKLGMSKPQTMTDMPGFGVSDANVNGGKTGNGLSSAGDGSEVLVTLGGKPVITEKILQEELDKMIAAEPKLKDALSMMPDAKRQLLMGLLTQLIIDEWAERNAVYSRPEIKKELENMTKQAKRAVIAQAFIQAHPVEVTEAELKAFYEKHKGMMQDKKFDEVKDMLKGGVEQEKQMQHIEGLIGKYKDEYGVQVNEDALKPEEGAMPAGLPGGMQEMSEEDVEEVSTPQAA